MKYLIGFYFTFLLTPSIDVSGVLSDWSAWGACSASCQLDYTVPTQIRTRTCLGASLGGNCDNQALNQSKNCNAQVYCPGTISDWSSWGTCSSICNNLVNVPFQTRNRLCIDFSTWDPVYSGCPGITTSDQQTCNVNVGCSGSYGAWSAWSSCSETCQSNPAANPFQTQTRQCLGATLGSICAGPSSQTITCNSGVPCPGVLSGWSAWGACSVSCQLNYAVPTHTSTRTCLGASLGGNCNSQALTQTKNCNAEIRCPGTISDWSSWGACSSTCNNLAKIPFQTRSRSCIGYSTWDPTYMGCPGITVSDQQPCNENVGCSGSYGAWSAWSSCSETCQSNPAATPFQTQTRPCLGATFGGSCAGPSSQTMACNSGVSCPGVLSEWSTWGECSASCQLDYNFATQTSTRTCLRATFGGNCNGQTLTQIKNCNARVYCPGTMSDWSPWGACSSECNNLVNIPFQTRSRSCISYSTWDPKYTGCPGITTSDQQTCNVNVDCSGGRPSILFEGASVRTKDRIIKELLSKYNLNELLYAASKSLKRDKWFIEAKVVSDYSAEVPLQALLFHTASRICSAYSVVLNSPVLKDCTKLFIIYKAGFDGAT
ncbi:properdin-like [Hydra vulgaris]|uniref:Properdin-like n=1 Tax=Hydra vulgaris TaxID=6087 RepID=A0ABM4CRL9_HYDVU